jgi:hypothetical protein
MKRVLTPEAPSPDYEQVGERCIYHTYNGHAWPEGDPLSRMNCAHGPLDCDIIPVWALKRDAALDRINGRA